ncbi:putative NADPH-adrenodoxin reductase Arh1 [Amylocarpus encephaloides]|uniref:NADPH:adrenodoxin oxidoreductase, mitochondrial n=1 Tax=Amylocarpus encephaloides TaxID=45428 RepID=A0A9P7YRY1_9HELO|nr:putative NADPH-adrenodoxin reductase Arh1 [Amylocarpus encephaloides]
MFEVARTSILTRCKNPLAHKTRPISRTTRALIHQRKAYSTTPHTQDGRPFRMAVIGSGPAGFYTSYKVMSKIENAVVDMYEQLPVPFGLVRFGVAPDHPEVKNCQDKFEEVAQSPRFNFVGNITIGEQDGALPLETLVPHYDAILFAYGASRDRTLGIPGEDNLKGIYSARAFVGWYNGLPEYAGLAPDLTQGEEAVVIGQGNVAMDVARILLEDVDALRKTDITENAIATLSKSRVKRVRVVGRRGPLQAAFTIKEVRELVKLPSVGFHPVDTSLIPEDIKTLPRPPRRIMEVLKKGGVTPLGTASKSWSLDFCMSPTSFNPSLVSLDHIGSVTFEKTSLSPGPFDPAAKAVGTGVSVDVGASLAFRSIGYKSEAIPGFDKIGVPFDTDKGVIPNDHLGRVVDDHENWSDFKTAKHLPGIYCAGWVKKGPTGVIANTMDDAFSTADSIAMDWAAKSPFLNGSQSTGQGWDGIKAEAERRNCRRVSWADWKTIDAVEKEKGREAGKEREKFTIIDEMLAVLD